MGRDTAYGVDLARALEPGGLFVFDLMVQGGPAPMAYRTWRAGRDFAVLIEVVEDRQRNLLSRDITTFRKRGSSYRRAEERHVPQVHERSRVERALRDAGFRVRVSRRYGEARLGPRRLVFWGRRSAAEP